MSGVKTHSRTLKVVMLALGQGCATLSLIALAAGLSRLLDKEDYATYQQSYTIYQFISPLLLLGAPAAIFYFLPRAECGKEKRRVLIDNLALLSLLGLLMAVGIAVLRYPASVRFSNEELQRALWVFAPYAVAAFPVLAVQPTLICAEKPGLSAGFQGMSRLFLLVVVLSATLIWRTPIAALSATSVAMFCILPVALLLMFKAVPGVFSFPRGRGIVEQLRYTIPLGVGSILGVMNVNLDKIIVSSLADQSSFAVYANGAVEIPMLALVAGQVAKVLQPELSKASLTGSLKPVHAVWARSILKTSMVSFAAMGFFMVFAEDFIVLLFSEKYRESSGVFMIYLLLLPVRSFQFGGLFAAMGQGRLIVFRAGIALFLNAVLSWLLVNYYGIMAAAWSTVLVTLFFVFPYCMVYSKKFFECEWKQMLNYRLLSLTFMICATSGLIVWVSNALLEDRILSDASDVKCRLLRIVVGGFVYLVTLSLFAMFSEYHKNEFVLIIHKIKKTFKVISVRFISKY